MGSSARVERRLVRAVTPYLLGDHAGGDAHRVVEAPAMCGASATLSSFSSGETGGDGSSQKASSGAPQPCRDFKA